MARWTDEDIRKFIDTVAPLAAQVCAERGYTNIQAHTCVAQACCESGYGTSGVMMGANAILGIKANTSWVQAAKYGGLVYSADTKECYDGKTYVNIKDTFRAYTNLLDSVRDYFDLMEHPRYRACLDAKTVSDCIMVIWKSGYATSPTYHDTVYKNYYLPNRAQIEKYQVKAVSPQTNVPVTTNVDTIPFDFKFQNPIKTNIQFAETALYIAKNYKTYYVNGAFGWVMTKNMKERAIRERSYNAGDAVKIRGLSSDTIGFDCICLLKSILWGWCGNYDHQYGGAGYAVNGVPDMTETAMIDRCNGATTDFSNVQVGEMLYYNVGGNTHAGIYIGDGLAVECTPQWKNGVQITAVLNIGKKEGYNGRKWTKHGMLPFFAYVGGTVEVPTTKPVTKPTDNLSQYTDEQLAQMVIAKVFGNNPQRQQILGTRYRAVQDIVNAHYNGQKASDVVYVVKAGDTLSAIASKHGTTYQKIAADNNIMNPNIIYIGQRLVIRK